MIADLFVGRLLPFLRRTLPVSKNMFRVLLATEGTFGGEKLRGSNIQPIATTLIYE
jgi:hypothetical protein